jgi:hypothetical protein
VGVGKIEHVWLTSKFQKACEQKGMFKGLMFGANPQKEMRPCFLLEMDYY